jgi:hypothetical protein
MQLKLVEQPDPDTQVILETAAERSLPPDTVVIAVAPNNPSDDVGPHVCGNCGQPLVRGPVEGRIDDSIVIQCPVCRAYNKVTG